ncbi:Smr/MutS family protein [Flavihumibacter sp. R14]|nr:Smr/MutS family protein [Flavihumibacter soli]
MKFKLGDFVRFVDERIEGYITRIIDDQTVAVTDKDGFEIPVMVSQITWVHGHEPAGRKAADEKAPVQKDFQSQGIYLAAVSDERTSSVVHFHVLNESSFQLLVSVKTEKDGKYKGEFSGELAGQSIAKIYSATLSELDKWPEFHIQILRYTSTDRKPELPLFVSRRFRGKDFAGAKKQVPLLKGTGWMFQLDEPELVIDAQKLKESFHKPAIEKKLIENPGKEVDLHIEKLRDDHQFLNSSEILDIQLNFFKKALEAAIVHKLDSIIFIHGTGNGTLKNEIHKVLSKHVQVKTFMDARKEKFGYGATQVVLK